MASIWHFILGYIVIVFCACATYIAVRGGWSLVTEREDYTPNEYLSYWIFVLACTGLALPLWAVILLWVYRHWIA